MYPRYRSGLISASLPELDITPRIVSILRNNMSICLNQLDNVALEIQDIVIGIKGSAIGTEYFQCKRLPDSS